MVTGSLGLTSQKGQDVTITLSNEFLSDRSRAQAAGTLAHELMHALTYMEAPRTIDAVALKLTPLDETRAQLAGILVRKELGMDVSGTTSDIARYFGDLFKYGSYNSKVELGLLKTRDGQQRALDQLQGKQHIQMRSLDRMTRELSRSSDDGTRANLKRQITTAQETVEALKNAQKKIKISGPQIANAANGSYVRNIEMEVRTLLRNLSAR